jgi:hypothetical protein
MGDKREYQAREMGIYLLQPVLAKLAFCVVARKPQLAMTL